MSLLPCLGISKRVGASAALIGASALLAPAAASAASCPVPPTTTPFAQWGDSASYFLIPDGNFEAPPAASGWLTLGAEQSSGDNPFDADGHEALAVHGGGVAISPAFCVDAGMPDIRFFARAASGDSVLQVRLILTTARGNITVPLSADANLSSAAFSSWAPTPSISVLGTDPLAAGTIGSGRLEFNDVGAEPWMIDDVYVDPSRVS